MIAVILIALTLLIAPFTAALPEEAFWTPILYAVVLVAAAISLILPGKSSFATPRALGGPIGLVGLFATLSFASLAYHWLVVNHGHPVFMDAMFRQAAAYLALTAMAAALSRLCTQRLPAYCVTIALLVGATVASIIGLQDYLTYVAIHQANHREFATSTPDYFAGFLVMTIPITLSLLIGSFSNTSKAGVLVYGLSLLIQLPVLAATGSRFAVAALLAGLISLGTGIWIGARTGIAMPKVDRRALVLVAIVILLGGAVAGHTILNRIIGPAARAQNNSIMFRWWTWKGAERTALANPLLGTGPGTFPYAYQRYAYVGFTRAAHDAYFQATTDTGFAAGIVLTIGLIWIYSSGMRSISRWSITPPVEETVAESSVRRRGKSVATTNEPTIGQQFLTAFAPVDDRLLIAGLASGFVAGLVHNLFDSDWYVTFNALTLWGIGGVLLAFARRAHGGALTDKRIDESAARQMPALLTAVIYAVGAVLFVCVAVAQSDANAGALAAQTDASGAITDPAGAVSAYQSAISINPGCGKYDSDLGFNVYQRMGDVPNTEKSLKQAIAVEPDATNYRRLGRIYLREHRPADALALFTNGLEAEWNDLDLYLLSAQAQTDLGNKEGALDSYRILAAYQNEKIGLYPALGDIVEIRYAQADIPLGDDALAHKSYSAAIEYYQRALPLFRQYVDQDGTMGGRQSLTGGHPDPETDTQIYALYQDDIKGLAQAYNATEQPALAAKAAADNADLDARFESIISQATKAMAP